MSLPYANSTSGEKALVEIQKILRQFQCDKFGTMIDWSAGTVIVQFEYRGAKVSFPVSFKGYAQMYLKEKPYTHRMRCSKAEYEKKADEIASVAIYSILRDWIKAQIMAVETGVVDFDEVFLAHIMLPSGKRFIEHARDTNMIALVNKD